MQLSGDRDRYQPDGPANRHDVRQHFPVKLLLFSPPKEAVSQCENHTNVILSRRQRISRFLPLAKARFLRLSPQDETVSQCQTGEI